MKISKLFAVVFMLTACALVSGCGKADKFAKAKVEFLKDYRIYSNSNNWWGYSSGPCSKNRHEKIKLLEELITRMDKNIKIMEECAATNKELAKDYQSLNSLQNAMALSHYTRTRQLHLRDIKDHRDKFGCK